MLQSITETDSVVKIECRAMLCRFNLCSQSEQLDLLVCNLKHIVISYNGKCDMYESTKDAGTQG